MAKVPTTAAFVSQKGGVGKSTLARLFAVGAAHRGHKTLLADFDLEQLTCVEWSALRLSNASSPDIDARAFKSLKKLRKSERRSISSSSTRAASPTADQEIAEDSDVVFLPTGTSGDDLRPTLALARKLAKHGAEGRLVVVLSKVGRSETQIAKAVDDDRGGGLRVARRALAAARRLPDRSRRRPRGSQRRAIRICARPPSGWRRRCFAAR